MKIAPLATLLGIGGGTVLGLVIGYFRGFVDDAVSRVIDAVLALPAIVIAVTAIVAIGTVEHDADRRHRRRSSRRSCEDGARSGARRARSRLCLGGEAAR